MTNKDPNTDSLPDGLWLAYYGDDFTGSTDVLEAFTAAGVPTVLFLQPPRPEDLARFPDARCVGLAGQSRGKSPAWMREHLPPVFRSLSSLGAPSCSTKCARLLTPHLKSAPLARPSIWA